MGNSIHSQDKDENGKEDENGQEDENGEAYNDNSNDIFEIDRESYS